MATRKKKNSKKEILFSAAMKIIGERGYSSATVDEIAAKAGVAKGVVYYYFSSKADLAEQIIKTGLEALAVRLDRVVEDDMTVEQAFTALAFETIRQINKNRDFAKFLLSEMWHEGQEWRDTLDRCVGEIVEIFEVVIKRGQDEGIFPAGLDVEFSAQTVFATFLASSLNRTVVHPDEDPDILAEQLARFAYAGLVGNVSTK